MCYVLFIGDGDTVSSENPALPQEGVKRPATHDDSNPSPKNSLVKDWSHHA